MALCSNEDPFRNFPKGYFGEELSESEEQSDEDEDPQDQDQGDQLNHPKEGDKNLNRDITGVVTSTAKSKSQEENSKLPPVPYKVVNTNQNGRR